MKNRNLDDLLLNNFAGIELKNPLFYNAPFGIRFEAGGEVNVMEKRVQQIKYRAVTLYNAVNHENDDIYLVIFMDSWEEHPVDYFEKDVLKIFESFIIGTDSRQINKKEQEYRYNDPDEQDNTVTIRYWVKLKSKELNIDNLLYAVANRAIGNDVNGIVGDLFLVNETRKSIFYLYDDRGLDIVAENKEILRPIYEQYNDWILDFDRERIKKMFGN
ncbi:DUF3885 domain-containing protein [Paenibacillus sp. FSL H3-0469]|uniref:DUF3885 domain-containing protein n=1 Tax=Paenibacillus sp. FSL H3-0469 TaxID=2954506 RepID=UPI0031018F85